MSKPNPDKVFPKLARKALEKAKSCNTMFSEYIILQFRNTGNLAPGCDHQDLIAWYKLNMLSEWEAKK